MKKLILIALVVGGLNAFAGGGQKVQGTEQQASVTKEDPCPSSSDCGQAQQVSVDKEAPATSVEVKGQQEVSLTKEGDCSSSSDCGEKGQVSTTKDAKDFKLSDPDQAADQCRQSLDDVSQVVQQARETCQDQDQCDKAQNLSDALQEAKDTEICDQSVSADQAQIKKESRKKVTEAWKKVKN